MAIQTSTFVSNVGDVKMTTNGRPYFTLYVKEFMQKPAILNVYGTQGANGPDWNNAELSHEEAIELRDSKFDLSNTFKVAELAIDDHEVEIDGVVRIQRTARILYRVGSDPRAALLKAGFTPRGEATGSDTQETETATNGAVAANS